MMPRLSVNVVKRADLHCHSNISDGVLSPSALAQRAHQRGVQLWSLTDHDTVAGIAEARAAAQALALPFLAGVEISVTWATKTVHIVGLGIDDTHPALLAGLAQLREKRLSRSHRMAQQLADMGVPDTYPGALQLASQPNLINRTHFARYLVQQGYCDNLKQAFDQYLGDGRKADVSIAWASLEDAVRWIRQAGGKAVIAHPGRYTYDSVQSHAFYEDFKQLGGQGIEVLTGSHRPGQQQQFAALARDYGFEASSGSDFHAPSESRVDLGGLPALPAGLTPVWHDMI